MKTTSVIKIRGYHIDHFGHVNHARYIEFLEEGRWDYMEKNQLIDLFHNTGIIHTVAGIAVDYKSSARAGNIIRMESALGKVGQKSFSMDQKMYLKESLILKAIVTNAFIDLSSQKPVMPNKNLINGWQDLADSIEKEV